MNELQYVHEEDIRQQVESDCRFDIEDYGIGCYECGDGKFTDKNLRLSLTSQEIVVQYPIDTESVIYTRVQGCYYFMDDFEEYECDYIAELSHIEYNTETKMFDATYEVNQG